VEQGCERKAQGCPTSILIAYWIDNHKPKSGPPFDITKESTKEFKYALRACRSQQKCKADAMTEALWNRSPKKFGQNIRKNKKPWLPSTVRGATGNKAGTVIWRKRFSAIPRCPS